MALTESWATPDQGQKSLGVGVGGGPRLEKAGLVSPLSVEEKVHTQEKTLTHYLPYQCVAGRQVGSTTGQGVPLHPSHGRGLSEDFLFSHFCQGIWA